MGGALLHAEMLGDRAETVAAGPAHRGRMGVHAVAAAVFPDTRVGLEGKPRRLDTQPFQQIEQPGIVRRRGRRRSKNIGIAARMMLPIGIVLPWPAALPIRTGALLR